MAWCESCEHYLTPATLTAEGSCPACGSEVQHPKEHHASEPGPASGDGAAEAGVERLPWHFWLLLAAAVVYLGWRAVQGIALLLALPGMAPVL